MAFRKLSLLATSHASSHNLEATFSIQSSEHMKPGQSQLPPQFLLSLLLSVTHLQPLSQSHWGQPGADLPMVTMPDAFMPMPLLVPIARASKGPCCDPSPLLAILATVCLDICPLYADRLCS